MERLNEWTAEYRFRKIRPTESGDEVFDVAELAINSAKRDVPGATADIVGYRQTKTQHVVSVHRVRKEQ